MFGVGVDGSRMLFIFEQEEKTCEILYSRLYILFSADQPTGTMYSAGTRIAAMNVVEHRFWLVYYFRERIKLVHFSQHSINASCMNIEHIEKHGARCTLHTYMECWPIRRSKKRKFLFLLLHKLTRCCWCWIFSLQHDN